MYKRGNIFWTCINGEHKSTETSDRKRAQTLETKWRHERWDAKQLGLKFAIWDQAVENWAKRNTHLKAFCRQGEYSRWWEPHLSGKRLQDISADFVLNVIKEHRPVDLMNACPQNATANLHLAFVVKIMRHANAPIRVTMLPVSGGREQWLTLEQWRSLRRPSISTELLQLATFSLASGLRRANVIGLQWSWIQGKSLMIPAEFTKTGKVYSLPLNKTAQAVIEERRRATIRHAHNVFLMQGKPIYPVQLHRAWNQCLIDSGIPHMPYHGLRHTYASWMVQAMVPFEIVARLGQWKLRGQVHRYAHFDVESLRPWAEKFDSILENADAHSVHAGGAA